MFGKNFQRKYALTDQGVKNAKKGAFWTVIVNLVVMGGMGILYLLMYGLMGTFTNDQPLPNAALLAWAGSCIPDPFLRDSSAAVLRHLWTGL